MRKSPLLLLLAAPLLGACSTDTVSVGVSARVGSSTTTAASRLMAQGTVSPQVVLSNGIEVQRVRLVVRKLELQDAATAAAVSTADAGSSDDDGSGHEGEFETGPFLIDLSGAALEGQLVSLPEVKVPAGVYEEIEYKIGVPSASQVGSDAALADMAQRQASAIIDGTIDGEAFSFVSGVSVEQEREVTFEVGGARDESVTINLDAAKWFQDGSGNRLDPRVAGNRSAIENNLQKSIDAFDDHDRDGHEDHDDDSAGDDHGGSDGGHGSDDGANHT
ncbi:hypothetical protein FGE12_26510 [Aggregicoccus sp. 17bor-14]|uniref:hypothetical protein n=1 Tax=Myxococcaceae TaxID=31 RepID=UPI00129CBA38|nr:MULTISPECIES: hypothetical protein [Myxococcaceae]MBF5045993.1 hypothetical protein [Simulacricoccus sp. 17bor-14]MRI91724.1 hypothetical protein [Aggregicoccus sp. 17bor-14]